MAVYDVTKEFPKHEIFNLISQMRRCAVSIISNIAEGFSRRSSKEKVQFYYISLGSITELQNQLIISRDSKYLEDEKFNKLNDEIIKVQKLINGLIRSIKSS